MLQFPESLASDNFAKVHPKVLQYIQEANIGHAMAYGADPWTTKAEELFKQHFGQETKSYPTFNGTGANVIALKQLLHPWQAVLCAQTAHIQADECGAVESAVGSRLITIPTLDGKITVEQLREKMVGLGNQHHVQPKLISITQSTELGTVYTIPEIAAISTFAKEHKLYLHMDGARLCNAAVTLGTNLKAMTTDLGVDILSFGGTKNGLMGAEAVIILNPLLAENFQYVRKQHMQLASKMRYISAQFVALLEGDLWKVNAHHANQMAKCLEVRLQESTPFRPLYPVEANALFIELAPCILQEIRKEYFFWIWDQSRSIARLMTSWDTSQEYIRAFVQRLALLSHGKS